MSGIFYDNKRQNQPIIRPFTTKNVKGAGVITFLRWRRTYQCGRIEA